MIDQRLLTRIAQNHPSVTALYFNHQIDGHDAKNIAKALKTNSTVTSIFCLTNQIGDIGLREFAKPLKNNKTIVFLDFIGEQIGELGAKSLGNALKVNHTLTSINLTHNHIGDEGLISLADALRVNNTLTSITLTNNRIGDKGAKSLADALKVNHTLTTITLYDNQIGDEGLISLADALKVNNTLTSIWLNNNLMGKIGAQSLADALKINKSITYINLSPTNKNTPSIPDRARNYDPNKTGDSNIIFFAKALKANATITSIVFYADHINKEDLEEFAEALKTNTTLLNFGFDPKVFVGVPLFQAVESALDRNKKIIPIFDAGQQALVKLEEIITWELLATTNEADAIKIIEKLNSLGEEVDTQLENLQSLHPDSKQFHNLRARWFDFHFKYPDYLSLAAVVADFIRLPLTPASQPYYQTLILDMISAYQGELTNNSKAPKKFNPETPEANHEDMIKLCLLAESPNPSILAVSLIHYFGLEGHTDNPNLKDVLLQLEKLSLEKDSEQDKLRIMVCPPPPPSNQPVKKKEEPSNSPRFFRLPRDSEKLEEQDSLSSQPDTILKSG